jgi:hypothetical protein
MKAAATGNKETKKLAKTPDDEESGCIGVDGAAAPGEPETVMANFWPNWQCWPTVQM